MTQQQLADLVHVSSRTIISIEKEQYSPSLMLAYRIAEVFGVTVEELCCLKENKELEDKQYENLYQKGICFRCFRNGNGFGAFDNKYYAQDLDINSIILIVALFAFGFGSIMRSISQRMTKEDKLEELDERNRLITMKSKSKSFQLTQIISFMLMLFFLVMGKVSGYEGFIAMGVGLAFAFAISMFSELFTYMYYESKY